MHAASGKFVIRLKPKLHEQLRTMSRQRNISLNDLCATKLSELNESAEESAVFSNHFFSEKFIADLLAQFPSLVGVILFGSAARNETTESSDIDLLLVLPKSVPVSREIYRDWDKMVLRLESIFPYLKKTSPHFVICPDSITQVGSLWFETALDGKVIWMKDYKLSNFLFNLREAMASGNIQRQISHGHPYWIRKAENEK